MGKTGGIKKETWIALGIAVLFFVLNLLFLTKYPFVHSDESWLAGLTRNMMQSHSFAVTEPFFNLKIRYPHAIKLLFHLLQMPFLSIFGYRIVSVRLLSLLAGSTGLFLFYRAGSALFQNERKALLAMALLAADAEFICASHLARQEIVILAMMLACVGLLFRHSDSFSIRSSVLLGVLTGLSVGIHPNSFMIACVCAGMLLLRILVYHTAKWKHLLVYAAVTGLFALVFIGISYLFAPHFISDYLAYGDREFEVFAPAADKFGALGGYFAKLYLRVSGTYYLPDVRLQFLLFPAALIACLVFAVRNRQRDAVLSQRAASLVAAVVMLIFATAFIGRFSQLSVVFLFPFCWLAAVYALSLLGKAARRLLAIALFAAVLTCSVCNIVPWLSADSYDGYVSEVQSLIPQGSITIGNLNAEFAFDCGSLLDYRNLAYLPDAGMSFSDYVDAYGVQYIMLTDELDLIYSTRPTWNILYGNPMWVAQAEEYVKEHCEYVGSFTDNTYNVHIVSYVNGTQDFSARVYRVVR